MTDTLQRFLFDQHPIRGELVHLDAAWRAVVEGRDYPPAVRTLLGESLAAAVLLSATLKFDGSLTLQVQGDGPVSLLVVEATAGRTVRGLAHWSGEVPESGLSGQFGDGRLVLTIDPGKGKRRYQGIVELRGEHLAEALEEYLQNSEQLPTRLWLTSDAARVGGLLLQRLPEGDEPDADAWNRVVTLGDTVRHDELLGLEPVEVFRRLFHEEDLRVFESEHVSFRCSCSRERVASALFGLGREEIESIVADQGTVEVHCEFCNRRYEFDAVDAQQVFTEQPQPTPPNTRH